MEEGNGYLYNIKRNLENNMTTHKLRTNRTPKGEFQRS